MSAIRTAAAVSPLPLEGVSERAIGELEEGVKADRRTAGHADLGDDLTGL
jgi:hypothetical protein